MVFRLTGIAQAQQPSAALPSAPKLTITRASGPIRIDGDLSDEAWRRATRIDKWYEVDPGDNTEPPVKSVGYLTYDERSLYVGFDFEDPNPRAIRAPFGDHDALQGSNTDFGGIFIDSLNTGRSASEFFASPRNIQYDAVTDDATGENSSPDFFWDSAAKINDHGWTLEMRIPFSTLRFKRGAPQEWGIIMLRNYPRTYRHQIASLPIPRGSNCTVCHASKLTDLQGLPAGGHLVVAPYASASETARPRDGVPDAPLTNGSVHGRAGFDVKYNPNADIAIDATVKPDFSQIESDTAQISANERFALFFPEKRPFFLEGVDLLQTPLQAVYTRTITAPTWGGRITGQEAGVRYTAFVAEDAGGGIVIIPGANDSSAAPQDFSSTVFVGRAKKDIGRSFIGALMADREGRSLDNHNRVFGPDFEWRPSAADVIRGQWLFSDTRTPDRPDLADEWDGRQFTGRALQTFWTHNTRHFDSFTQYTDIGDGFRADTGFVPQVDYREGFLSTGWQVHPKGLISRERTFVNARYQVDRAGRVITENVMPGFGMDTRLNGFVQIRYTHDKTRAGDLLIARQQFGYTVQFNPSRRIAMLLADSTFGQDIDFANARPAHGITLNLEARLRPTDHLDVDLIENTRTLRVDAPFGPRERLFVQRVSRVRGTYTFTARLFVRAIGQYVATTRDPALYTFAVDRRSGDFSGSALFAYKLNWQSVVFVGYGDDRDLSEERRLRPVDRQLFVKLSYAIQR
jgi:Domain of unknown function (DUF5916)/Carbohydrate family 9 binding domain-like